jgi:UTP-glucose-1-phosphate uridylyltransferase
MIKLALIPAGGLGINLLPLTRAFPKELFPIVGKPVIEHVIDNVKSCGIKNVVFVAGHKKSALLDYIGDGSLFGINATFVYQEIPSGPGDAILSGNIRIKRDSENQDFLVCFGDNIVIPHTEILTTINKHEKYRPLATILVFQTTVPTRYGITQIKEINNIERIVKVIEKPKNPEDQENFRIINGSFLALSSVMVFNIRIFDYLRQTTKGLDNRLQIADALNKAIDNGEQIIAHKLDGQFIDVSEWDFLWEIRKYYRNLTDDELAKMIDERNALKRKLGW